MAYWFSRGDVFFPRLCRSALDGEPEENTCHKAGGGVGKRRKRKERPDGPCFQGSVFSAVISRSDVLQEHFRVRRYKTMFECKTTVFLRLEVGNRNSFLSIFVLGGRLPFLDFFWGLLLLQLTVCSA